MVSVGLILDALPELLFLCILVLIDAVNTDIIIAFISSIDNVRVYIDRKIEPESFMGGLISLENPVARLFCCTVLMMVLNCKLQIIHLVLVALRVFDYPLILLVLMQSLLLSH